MKARILGIGSGVAAAVLPVLAHAEVVPFTITPPALDMALLGTLSTAILGGLAAIWLLRKVIKTMNKS